MILLASYGHMTDTADTDLPLHAEERHLVLITVLVLN